MTGDAVEAGSKELEKWPVGVCLKYSTTEQTEWAVGAWLASAFGEGRPDPGRLAVMSVDADLVSVGCLQYVVGSFQHDSRTVDPCYALRNRGRAGEISQA